MSVSSVSAGYHTWSVRAINNLGATVAESASNLFIIPSANTGEAKTSRSIANVTSSIVDALDSNMPTETADDTSNSEGNTNYDEDDEKSDNSNQNKNATAVVIVSSIGGLGLLYLLGRKLSLWR
jgi:hypothetical protein